MSDFSLIIFLIVYGGSNPRGHWRSWISSVNWWIANGPMAHQCAPRRKHLRSKSGRTPEDNDVEIEWCCKNFRNFLKKSTKWLFKHKFYIIFWKTAVKFIEISNHTAYRLILIFSDPILLNPHYFLIIRGLQLNTSEKIRGII